MFLPPSACVILVPANGAIEPDCESALRELERRGHPVWRVRGYAAIDAARNQMATDALAQGFEELMWIDSDIAFDPDDIAKLRAHDLPVVCGLYPKKGPRQFACEFLPDTPGIRLGRRGGLVTLRYCGFGFVLTRKPVYTAIHQRLKLPIVNQRFGVPLVPFFEPMTIDEGPGKWSLGEDYAFCERARRAGFQVVADTSIRLWHVGPYRYGWEDAGGGLERFDDYVFCDPDAPPGEPLPRAAPPESKLAPGEFTEDWFTRHIPVWEGLFATLAGQIAHILEIGVFEGRSSAWLLDQVLTHPNSTLTWIDTFGGSREHTGMDLSDLEARFRANTARFGPKIRGYVGASQHVLRGMTGPQFDVIYIDGSHEAADVLADAVLAWPLLKPGGLLGFDDYQWRLHGNALRHPGVAVDAFLTTMRDRVTVLHRDYQVWVRKDRD